MADPLSIATGIVALLGASTACGKKLVATVQSFRNAPLELVVLSNEVSDLTTVLAAIEAAVSDIAEEHSQGFAENLEKASQALHAIEETINTIVTTSAAGAKEISNIAWVKGKKGVKKHLNTVKTIRLSLHVLLSAKAASHVGRIELALQSLHVATEQFRIEGRTSFESLQQTLTRLEGKSETVTRNEDRKPEGQVTVTVTEVEDQPPAYYPRAEEKPRRGQPPSDHDSKTLWEIAMTTVQRSSINKCYCGCVCHKRRRMHTPLQLQIKRCLGALFLGYSGLPGVPVECDKPQCTNRNRSGSLEVKYCFPEWFLKKAIHVALATGLGHEPKLSLTLRRRTPFSPEDSIYRFARTGNLEGIRALFTTRVAFPNDVDFDFGQTALHYAIDSGQYAVCRFLLDAGADPTIESDYGASPVQQATSIVLSQNTLAGAAGKSDGGMLDLFPGSEHFESWEFSRLHRIVLGLEPGGDLTREILSCSSPSMLDELDSRGRTPLYWAALRGDENAVKQLLLGGANPRIADSLGVTPLHVATNAPSPRCIELLVLGGSDVRARDFYGRQPMHQAVYYHDSIDHVKPLLQAGAPLEGKSKAQGTPLSRAAAANNVLVGEYLLDLGANMHNRDEDGDTPLSEAVRYSCHAFLDMLLKRRVDHRLMTNTHSTVLHVAAQHGDVGVSRILAAYSLRDLDPDARDDSGKTATELLSERIGVSEELELAFSKLLESVAMANEESSMEGSWMDALSALESEHTSVDGLYYAHEMT
ncbi:hypothetical protein B0T16DRAFT_443837 [Cercophora newfieldiana]|uniref:Azaphilone pigments biosynthesis cluster protein L N-terminal domain-containing protein n=1 Tax=Cercophora newfieldiana TaxID=92897 RepID=A0AA39YHD7_9PEZI|nr:hypothetical protein B0T16DRAFT_443837 [Cercophora newfieldiana]